MNFLDNFLLPTVLGICLCSGYIMKQWIADIDNKYIPTIVAILGVILSIWMHHWTVTPEIILEGMCSGLASTGMHQLFKQYIEKKETPKI
ncbi:MAG: holin [Hespellia sp.]|nr:holin [Hespellia sp.]